MAGLTRRWAALTAMALAVLLVGCQRKEAPRRYPLRGQVLAVDPARNVLSVKHEDIPNFMPAMTMVYDVAPAAMQGRTPGELITATLEVENSIGRLIEITHAGTAPLDENTAAMALGMLDVGSTPPDTALIDQSNRRRSLSEWTGIPYLITFTYTRCPLANFCPLMDQNFATIQRRLADDTALHGNVRLVSVTIDPVHDTPDVLAAHAAKLKADPAIWTFLTADAVTIERFAGAFGIGIMRDTASPSEITHNLRTALVGADGKIVKVYSGSDWTPGTVLSDLHQLQIGN